MTGFVPEESGVSCRSIEFIPRGDIVFPRQLEGAGSYRAFRVPDLYTPKEK